MRILYAIQGTGNGHFSRAREFIPWFGKFGELDLLVSGTSVDVDLGHPIRYRMPGISYTFGRNGGIDYLDTALKLRPGAFLDGVMQLQTDRYDVLVNDFEPVSAWAAARSGMECVGLSHQAAFLSRRVPRPPQPNAAAEWLFKYYAPCTKSIGFHFQRYDEDIYTPVIRQEIRSLKLNATAGRHATVYLPSYADEILLRFFRLFPTIEWHVFSKHTPVKRIVDNVILNPIQHEGWLQSLGSSFGIICGGGFEAPSECLYLGKKLMVIPMRDQYEQQCNAEALRRMGVCIAQTIDERFQQDIERWLDSTPVPEPDYPDHAEAVVAKVMDLARSGACQVAEQFTVGG